VKFSYMRHMGDLEFVDVPADGAVKVKLNLCDGNRLATYPSITPDGRTIVCLSQHAWYDPAKQPPEQGFDTMTAVSAENGTLLALWDPTKNGGAFAKDPRLSPDGRLIAFAMGLPGMESLAVCPLDSFLRGAPEARVVVPGERVLAQYVTGNVSPAFSPDGRRLAFVRCRTSGTVSGNLYVVDAAGGTPRQVTALGQNQCPTYPSWSPAGTHIAFQVVTSRGPALDLVDLVRRNVTSDIMVVGADGSGLRAITTEGRSGQPAWGP
jgi:Tol biopolymer transport system component